jgi:phytoene dehydrogenase-like protein
METRNIGDVKSKNYDVIIIGSGMGGLTAGCYLAKRGAKVLIVEQMNYSGGCICEFRHKGFYFDGGPTSVSFLKILQKVYGDFGLWEDINLIRVNHQMIAPNLNIIIDDRDTLIKELEKVYPDSKVELREFFDHLRKIVKAINPIYDHHPSYKEGLQRILAQITMPLFHFKTFYTALKYTNISKKETIEKFIKTNAELKQILLATGYSEIATVDLAFMWETFTGDLYYPKGGMVGLINPLVKYFNENGGDILYNKSVDKIITNGNTVTEIQLNDGNVLKAPLYISNSDYKRTFLQYIGEDKLEVKLVKKLKKAEVTEPILNLFLGLNIDVNDLPVIKKPNSMLFIDDGIPHYLLDRNDPDYYKKVHLSAYIPSYNDYNLNEPGKTSFILATIGNYHFENNWRTENGKRGQAYYKLKDEISEILIQRLEKIMPNIRKYIVYKSLATPITYERYTSTWEGASCGWAGAKDKAFFKNYQEVSMGHLTPFKNLFMAGQWTYFNGGIPSAMTSGRTTGLDVANIVKKENKKRDSKKYSE